MTQMQFGTRPLGYKHNAGVAALLLLLGIGCMDVGHVTEVGCLKDMTEPGCTPGSGGKVASGGRPASGGRAASGGKATSASNAGASGMATSSGAAGNASVSDIAGAAGEANSPQTNAGSGSSGAAGAQLSSS